MEQSFMQIEIGRQASSPVMADGPPGPLIILPYIRQAGKPACHDSLEGCLPIVT
jgi:hypothetical protein